MEQHELNRLLDALRAELESGKPVDDSLRASLAALDGDIRKVLAEPAATTPVTEGTDGDLTERAREIEARFAADHPYLTSALNDLLDRLGKMGI